MRSYSFASLFSGLPSNASRIPPWAKPPQNPQERLRVMGFYGGAVITGILLHLLLIGGTPGRSSRGFKSNGVDCPSSHQVEVPSLNGHSVVEEPYTRPGLGQYVAAQENEWPMDRIQKMVDSTKGYFVRDYSVWLGWNNMRYIIEAGALQAKLLNRTLVVPSYVYARSCEHKVQVCAQYCKMVNRGLAIGTSEWVTWPMDLQMGWHIPIDVMLDLDNMRNHVSVITVAEYLTLRGMNSSLESSNGAWNHETYHEAPNSTTLATIPNSQWDTTPIVRVDKLPSSYSMPRPEAGTKEFEIHEQISGKMSWTRVLPLDEMKRHLEEIAGERWSTEAELNDLISKYGFGVISTFKGKPDRYEKSVTLAEYDVAKLDSMRGVIDDYDHHTEEVLYIPGELHDKRPAGFMYFTGPKARNNFAIMVLRGITHLPSFETLANAIAKKLLDLNDGRMWVAAHMRRGDFARYNWVHDSDVNAAIDKVHNRVLDAGDTLRQINKEPLQLAQVPGVTPDHSFDNSSTPLKGDRWYLATDERSVAALDYARSKGAILIQDILIDSPHLRRLAGWPLLYTDVLALLEQSVMARAAAFNGYVRSSVPGGVVNIRGIRGMDIRSTILDE